MSRRDDSFFFFFAVRIPNLITPPILMREAFENCFTNLKSVSKSSFTSISPSVWNWLPVPVCGIFPPHLSLKVSSRLFCFDRLFRKYRRTTLGCTDYAYIFFLQLYCHVPMGFLPKEIRVAFLGESQLRHNRTTKPKVLGVLVFP